MRRSSFDRVKQHSCSCDYCGKDNFDWSAAEHSFHEYSPSIIHVINLKVDFPILSFCIACTKCGDVTWFDSLVAVILHPTSSLT